MVTSLPTCNCWFGDQWCEQGAQALYLLSERQGRLAVPNGSSDKFIGGPPPFPGAVVISAEAEGSVVVSGVPAS